MLRRLHDLRASDPAFKYVEIDHYREFWEAVRLGQFDDLETGLAEITNLRTHSHPSPPSKAISTIHKAKGLECGSVVLMPGDAKCFPDKMDARCLLYVALSRAKNTLTIIASRSRPTPLFIV